MAAIVGEIMNRELFTLRTDDSVEDALSFVLALGVGGAPVLSRSGALVGVMSLRDLLRDRKGATVGERMSARPVTVLHTATIAEAGRLLGETGYHRLVVVDEEGRIVGVVSTLDVIRGLLGMPAVHPSTFPHYDAETGLIWTDDWELRLERVPHAPEGGGILALVRGGAGEREIMVWVEATDNIQRRLVEMISMPDEQTHILRRVLSLKELRFRAAAVADADERERLVTKLVSDMQAYWGALR